MPAFPGTVYDLLYPGVLWAATGFNGYGEPTVSSSPVQIRIWVKSWNDRMDSQRRTGSSEETRLVAEVYVDRVVAIGSHFWRGTLASYVEATHGTDKLYVTEYKEMTDPENPLGPVNRLVKLARLRQVA